MESMSYDRVKFGICVPTAGLVRAATCFSLTRLTGTLAQNKVYQESKEQTLTFYMREGSGIGSNRQKMVDEALEGDCTHIVFVDDDMNFTPEAFYSIARRRLPIVITNYTMRFENPDGPNEFTAVHLERSRGRMVTSEASGGLEPCSYGGFGLSIIEARVFKALDKPYFLNRYIEGTYTTEDLPFFLAAKEKLGITAYVDQDASKMVAHMGVKEYRWNNRAMHLPPDWERQRGASPSGSAGAPADDRRPGTENRGPDASPVGAAVGGDGHGVPSLHAVGD